MENLQQGHVIELFNDAQEQPMTAIVVGNRLMNDHMASTYICPITETDWHNPFHHNLEKYEFAKGFVMCDRITNFVKNSTTYKITGHLSKKDMFQILDKINMLIETE